MLLFCEHVLSLGERGVQSSGCTVLTLTLSLCVVRLSGTYSCLFPIKFLRCKRAGCTVLTALRSAHLNTN